MFTGIIEEMGTIYSIAESSSSAVLSIQADKVLEDSKIGDSIAVNGVCLTVTSIHGNIFSADVMAETLRRSSLGALVKGSRVNLERAMAAGGRFGGHIISGHIDGTGKIVSKRREDNAVWVKIEANPDIMKFIVEKGSIAIDGISLTVAALDNETFSVSVIPHTGSETTLLAKSAGDIVNLENDIVGKYVEKLLNIGSIYAEPDLDSVDNISYKAERSAGRQDITLDFLAENGF